MKGELILDNKGQPEAMKSMYQPSSKIRDFTSEVKVDYETGYNINHKPFQEFNNRSLITIMNDNQRKFNNYIEPKSEDPNESWRWNGIRPITRSKIISMAAHLTARTIFPNTFAQNDQDELDKQAGNTMRDLIKYNIKHSDYEEKNLFAVLSALVNPIVWMKVEFNEVIQTIKERQDNGELTYREVVDEVLSGLQSHIVPADEMLIADPYQYDEQKQRFLIRKRMIDYSDAKALYEDHKNFQYVQRGVRALFNEDDGMFYDQFDDSLDSLAEEVTYYNRQKDIEVVFVNGIYLGDDDPAENMMSHRRTVKDQNGKPVEVPIYPFSKSGYEPIDEGRFIFYKSAVEKLAPEQDLVDTMYRMVMDGTFLSVMPPVALRGVGEEFDEQVIYPGGVTSLPQEGSVEPLQITNLNAGYRALQEIERSMSESSQDKIRQGIPTSESKTAFEMAQVERNARIQLGLFGKMIARLVTKTGYLMIDLIIHHQTVGQVEEILGGSVRMKYRSFLLPDEEKEGKRITKKIEFDESLVGKELTPKERERKEDQMASEIDEDMELVRINPERFANMKFLITVSADNMIPESEAFEKAIKLEAYDRMIANPYTEHKSVTRDFLVNVVAKGEADKYMAKGEIPAQMAAGGGKTTPLVEQATKTGALKGLLNQQ